MPALPSFRRRTPLAVLAVALVASAAGLASVSPAVAAAPGCSFSQLDVVAHEDDDLLFQSPDLIDAITNGSCVTTAYLTAGDDGLSTSYWQGREAGMKAAYAQMAGVADSWTTGSTQLSGQTVTTATLNGRPTVELVFFRLPDGGYPGARAGSLSWLDQGYSQSIAAVDGSATYTKASLTGALLALMEQTGAETVHTQDYTGPYRDADHFDHTATAFLTRDAADLYTAPHTLVSYMDYETQSEQPNVSGAALDAKVAAFRAYAAHDPQLCGPIMSASCVETAWLQRQVIVNTRTSGGTTPTTPVTPTPTPTATPAPTETAAPVPTQQPTVPAPTQPAPVTPTTPVTPTAPPTTPTAPALPAERGTVKVVLKDGTLTTKQFVSKGVSATISGLTPGKRYRLSYAVGDSGALIGAPVTANAKGSITGTWKPSTKAAPALARAGRFALRVVGVQTSLTVAKAFTVKYESHLSWRSAHRSGSKVTFTVAASRATTSKDVAWKNVVVSFQKRVGSTWRTVATDRTNAKGVAVRTVKAGTATWRAVVKATDTVWSDTSRSVKR